MITHDIYINALDIVPEKDGLTNVVARVYWDFLLTDGEFVSSGAGYTDFDSANPDNFIPTTLLSEQQVCDWVKEKLIQQGFYDEIVSFHTNQIAEQRAAKELVRWTQPLIDPKPRPVINQTTIVMDV